MTLSAKGTRLNKRGLETREHLLRTALRLLADGGPDAASASSVAREAGATWGTVQHQFGDVDGLWAAVLEYVLADRGALTPRVSDSPDLTERVDAVLDLLWNAMDLPASRAAYWQASHASGFSSEQATASTGVYSGFGAAAVEWPTVVLAIFVAGRERR